MVFWQGLSRKLSKITSYRLILKLDIQKLISYHTTASVSVRSKGVKMPKYAEALQRLDKQSIPLKTLKTFLMISLTSYGFSFVYVYRHLPARMDLLWWLLLLFKPRMRHMVDR